MVVSGWDGGNRARAPRGRPASALRASRAPLVNACAFPQLRTLTGFDPLRRPRKCAPCRKGRGAHGCFGLGRRESRPRSARTSRFGAPRLACSAGKRLRVSAAPHPHGVRSPPQAKEMRPMSEGTRGAWLFRAGTEGIEPPTAGTKNRSSTVELRPNMLMPTRKTRRRWISLPNRRAHRKRHRANVRQSFGHRSW